MARLVTIFKVALKLSTRECICQRGRCPWTIATEDMKANKPPQKWKTPSVITMYNSHRFMQYNLMGFLICSLLSTRWTTLWNASYSQEVVLWFLGRNSLNCLPQLLARKRCAIIIVSDMILESEMAGLCLLDCYNLALIIE